MEDLIEGSVKESLAGITIVGLEDVRIDDVEQLLTNLSSLGQFQLMDARFILGEDHVRFACYEASRAFESGQNVTASLAMEILVRAACTTQISEAIRILGIKKDCSEVVLVGIESDDFAIKKAVGLTRGTRSSRPLQPTPEKRRRVKETFSLSEPVGKTLMERIALVAVD